MEHPVQGLVLVNGEWVSRSHDVYQIMAAARQEDAEMQDATTKPTSQSTDYGFLSRTLFSTPVSKFILPANIRHTTHNDVVLVSEDSVELKTIRDYGHLTHVSTKSDFKGARILAAKVFGDPREVPVTRTASGTLTGKHGMQRERRSMTGDEDILLPPEVIVLTLTNRTLMFLWAQPTHSGAVTFKQRTIRLPAPQSRIDRFGTFLAIDLKHRAIAVAAYEGHFILYKTKSMQQWRAEHRSDSDTTPIQDERIISLEGRIMHMTFLSSGGGLDDFHVVLLFIVAHRGKTKITCFDWDCRQDLSRATARTERVLVDFEDHNPSLLIPLSRSSGFLMIFDDHISVYTDVLSGIPIRITAKMAPHILSPLNPGDSKSRPRWVGWDKTPRNPGFSKEVFYITREDGRIIYAERGPANSLDVSEAGVWPYRIDTAFACLSVDSSEYSQLFPDVLIAGGSGNDGLVCKVGSWPTEYSYTSNYTMTNQITYIESISNWAPLADISVTRLLDSRGSSERECSSIFVANGNSPHGELSELRYGLQASVDDAFSGMTGCTGLWVLDYGSQTVEIDGKYKRQHHVTFAIKLPPETLVIRIFRTQPESRGNFSGAWEYGVWNKDQIPSDDEPIEDGIMRGEETLSACPWSGAYAIQITRHEARMLYRPLLHLHDSVSFNHPLLLAVTSPETPYVVVTYRESGSTYLEIIQISHSGHFQRAKETRLQLDHDPTCIEMMETRGTSYVFVSTFDSQITLFRVDDHGSISPVLEASLNSTVPDGLPILCESAVILESSERQILVCATRNGLLLEAILPVLNNVTLPMNWRCTKMGTTSAQIRHSQTDKSAAFVSSGPDFCRVRYSATDFSNIEIESVWFTTRTDAGYSQSPVTAMYQLPFMEDRNVIGRNLGGFLFAVAGDQLLFSQLHSDIRLMRHDTVSLSETDAKAVPRKLITGTRPTNAIYLDSLRKMIISTMEAKEVPQGYRVLYSALKLLNVTDDKPLDEPEIKQEEGSVPADRLVVAQCHLEHAERVHCIVDWSYVDHQGKKRSLVIVGTSVQIGQGKLKGRRLIFSTGKSRSKLQLQKDSTYEYPVYSIAMWGNDSIVSVIGKTLSLEFFDSQAGRWVKRGTKELPSPGMHISTAPPFVYVSTLQHSHICYKIVGATREARHEFEQVFTDSRERSSTSHVVLDLPAENVPGGSETKLVLVTDRKSSSIVALDHPLERSYRNASDTVFEATLPHTVIRLQRGNVRPPWRRPVEPTTGILADDVIGACSDGTIYTFSILSRPARRLLRFLQDLINARAARDPTNRYTPIKLRSGQLQDVLMNGTGGAQGEKIRAIDVNPLYRERGRDAPRYRHVDGDLLVKWLREGGELGELVEPSGDTERDVWELFGELAGQVCADWGRERGAREEGVEGVLRGVRMWLGEVLRPVL